NCKAATVLNLSEDHLDRHRDMDNYAAIKARIFNGSGVRVLNADDPRVAAMAAGGRTVVYFSLHAPAGEADYGLRRRDGVDYLARGDELLLAVDAMRMPGRHNQANALAALALGEAAGLELPAMLETLRTFPGLPHRCQWITEHNGVGYYDDSKGTNVGATRAALEGMPGEKVVLIAGGQAKGQAFSPLRAVVGERVRRLILIGEDAEQIASALHGSAPIDVAADMRQAVAMAAAAAAPGDAVLLSPACASFDMFSNYIERGKAFCAAVEELAA
ncbi:MAG: UDP-N-acetylmuramoyl-L-alanine--D-glutamate ligase, partial [Pseudomonadota bacterium]